MPGGQSSQFAQQAELLAGLTLQQRARQLAHGLYLGSHRSASRGDGVEFAGHRPYSPGDDLRRLDRHALARHGRYLIREFETESERALHVVVDASPSMNYAPAGQGESKLDRAILLAAASLLIARKTQDPIGLTILGPQPRSWLPSRRTEALPLYFSQLEQLEHQATQTRQSTKTGQTKPHPEAKKYAQALPRELEFLGERLPRGANLLFLSDFWQENLTLLLQSLGLLQTSRRTALALRILTPDEINFEFQGSTRFIDPVSGLSVESDAGSSRQEYLKALLAHSQQVDRELAQRGVGFESFSTQSDPASNLEQAFLSLGRIYQ
ncbi:MAG: DUF58 domain-containing protein [Polyangiaceae bacterium]|nr:DUF58 domain-containing protein [Polyangiaceae bacterium]